MAVLTSHAKVDWVKHAAQVENIPHLLLLKTPLAKIIMICEIMIARNSLSKSMLHHHFCRLDIPSYPDLSPYKARRQRLKMLNIKHFEFNPSVPCYTADSNAPRISMKRMA